MKQNLLIILLSAALGIIGFEALFPRHKPAPTIPIIVTKYDTVRTVPSWLADSVKKWSKVHYQTDTINLTVTKTLVDTQYVDVTSPDTTKRPDLWALLDYHGGQKFGDTATVTSFSVRSGNLVAARVFVPGILTDIHSDSNSTPKLTFAPFPPPHTTSLITKLFYVGLGVGACVLPSKVH